MLVLTRPKASALLLLAGLLAQGSACSQEIRQFEGASGGAGGAGGAGGSGGGEALAEDCLNGDDDDGDGKRDCDDEDCAPDFECVPPAPDGWIGPVSLYKGPPEGAPTCPAGAPDTIYNGLADLQNDPAQCSACSCDPMSISVNCNLSPLEAYETAGCVGPKNLSGQSNNSVGVCSFKSLNNAPQSFRAQQPPANASGQCAPSQVEATLPPPAWASIAIACSRAALGKGCGSQLCAPRGKPPFEAALCIVQKGDLECPAPYVTRHTFTDDPSDVTDTRGCEPCSCGQAQGTCSAVTSLYSTPLCGGVGIDVPNDGTCVEGMGMNVSGVKVTLTKQASCPPGGGAATGSIAPANTAVTTACCLP